MNEKRIDQILTDLVEIEAKVKKDLQSTLLSSGKIKSGNKTAHDFNEGVIAVIIE